MRVQDILRQQFINAHHILEQTVADVEADDLHRQLDGATIASIAHIYAHIVYGEDGVVLGMVQEKPRIWVTAGLQDRTGIDLHRPYSPDLVQEIADQGLAILHEYAAAVFAATDAYLSRADNKEMARIVDTRFLGVRPVANLLGEVAIWHVANHTGEIAALKGAMGRTGLPF